MDAVARPLRRVPVAELLRVGVWQFASESPQHAETSVQPVRVVPVESLTWRIAALSVRLADGTSMAAILGNIDLQNVPRIALGRSVSHQL